MMQHLCLMRLADRLPGLQFQDNSSFYNKVGAKHSHEISPETYWDETSTSTRSPACLSAIRIASR
jgi:hypothetical protein